MKNYLEYKDYVGSVNFSSEDGVYYGKLESVDDLVSFEGKTVEELETNFIEAVKDYLVTCKTENKTPKKIGTRSH